MALKYEINFINKFQESVWKSTSRHQCGSGGFGNGKTTIFCKKIQTLLFTFPKYRVAILRRKASDLVRTTQATFFSWCPEEMYDPSRGGNRVDSRNYCKFINGSEVFWLHLDDFDENVVRGLEVNSVFIDQAEEIAENIYLMLDARVGRWQFADIPPHLNPQDFPLNSATGRRIVPAYMMIGCNPDTKLHWIYKRYHPDSEDYTKLRVNKVTGKEYRYCDTHVMYQASSLDNPALTEDNRLTLTERDDAFVDRFVLGKWGVAEGTIHKINSLSLIDNVSKTFVSELLRSAQLYRILDHGATGITACLWVAAWKNWHIIYREYYREGLIVSEHRANIDALGRSLTDEHGKMIDEKYLGNFADPSIFHKSSEKYGGFWCTADEYSDISMTNAPAIHWSPADNNELMTRNRINELLYVSERVSHPFTGVSPSPRIFFLRKCTTLPDGCDIVITQTQSQKRKEIGTIDGIKQFSDDRDDGIPDHLYDTLRYYTSTRSTYREIIRPRQTEGTFIHALRNLGRVNTGPGNTRFRVTQ